MDYEKVSSIYGLTPIQTARPVAGGLSHRLLKLETEIESYALKILSPRSTLTAANRHQFERAETVAQIAAQNDIPALVAIPGSNNAFLQHVDGNWVLLYDWLPGEVLPPSAVAPEVAAQIGTLLGRLHALKIRFEDQSAPQPEAFEDGHWEQLVERGQAENAEWGDALDEELPRLIEANRRAMEAQTILREGWVTGHLDFDQKNVLWHEGQPIILDFESAKPIHPALELVGQALNWAGFSAGHTEKAVFTAFLRAYLTQNTVSTADLNTACDAVLGKWLIWLEFNLRRSLETEIRGTEEERICLGALWHALGATLKLLDDVSLYQEWCSDSAFPMSRSKSDS